MLALEGSYEVPGGPLGNIFNRRIGERIAIGQMGNLLGRLRAYVKQRYRDVQLSSPTVEQLNALSKRSKESDHG